MNEKELRMNALQACRDLFEREGYVDIDEEDREHGGECWFIDHNWPKVSRSPDGTETWTLDFSATVGGH